MPEPPSIEALDDHLLRDLYDPGALRRGRAYADEDRVNVLSSDPGAIKAVCRGSGQATYVIRIQWTRGVGGRVELGDSCTCPIGGGCKHCVATILTSRRQTSEPGVSADGSVLSPNWRQVLSNLATIDRNQGVTYPEVALQIAVHRQRPSRYVFDTGPKVTIRPMRRGKGGKWIKTGASWRELTSAYGYGPSVLPPIQRSALAALMASGRIDHYSNAQAVSLAQFDADVWYQLERATDAGIEMIGERATDIITLSPEAAQVGVDLTADTNGNVTLSIRFTVDDEQISIGDANGGGLVGSPPHGLWSATGDHLRLIPLSAPLHPTIAKLTTSGVVTVPARDVDELLDDYRPGLEQHASVASSDSSVTLTATKFDGLVLSVERTALDTVDLRWLVRYRRGDRLSHYPLNHRYQYLLREPDNLGGDYHRSLASGGSGSRSRDWTAESGAVSGLDLPTHLLPTLLDSDGLPRDMTVSGSSIIPVLTEVLPWIESKCGVDVELTGDYDALREADEDPVISLTVTDGDDQRDGNDWFDLNVEVTVDGETVDFVSLFAALNEGDEALILQSGTWLRLDRPEFERLRELIDEARGLAEPTSTGVARVNRFQVSWWEELARLGIVTEQSQRWADSVARMGSLTAPEPVAPPAGLDATLRPYQQDGLDWLVFLHRNRLGGILADDMGLGKTVQALALSLHIHDANPAARFLVVAPTSVVENWAREAHRFAPGITVKTIRETAARRGTSLEDEIEDASLVVTSYALFRLEFEEYARQDWELLLLDEAQFVKNHRGKTYQCVRRLDAVTKIAITGTPIENSLMDLWSLLSITAPGLYPDPKRFSDTFRKPIESGSTELLAILRRRIGPLLRRRTKDAVLTELPPKIEQVVEVELSPRHARIYSTQLQRQRQKVLGLVGDVQKNRFEILKSLTVLRQLALDPGLIDDKYANVGSAKLDRLLDDLEQVVAEGHRALVFSQFTRYLARVRDRLESAGIDYAYLDGRTRKRDEAISRFKDGDAPVFVISLKAGGVGLNLTEADYCFVLDPWWNPATETQAVDRAHRIGQQNQVMVYRYVATGTIEDKIMELKARKADLFNSVMDAEGTLSGALTENDIRGLLDLS